MKHRARKTDPHDPPALRVGHCPSPEKIAYATKASAKRILSRITGVSRKGTIHPYRCVCGTWHLGHKPGSRKNRADAFERAGA